MDATPTPLASPDQTGPLATHTALAVIEHALGAIDHAGRRGLTPAHRLALAACSRGLADRLESLAGVLLAEADRADAAMTVRGTPTTSWLALEGTRTRGEATRLVLTAAEIGSHPGVRDAAIDGRLTPQQASRLGHALSGLPDDLTDQQRAAAEELLIERGLTTPAAKIPRLVPDVLAAVLAPAPTADEAEHQRLAARRHYAIRRRSLTFTPDGIGSVYIRGSLPEIEASAVKKLIDTYVESDRRAERDARTARTAASSAATAGSDAAGAAAAGAAAGAGSAAGAAASGAAASGSAAGADAAGAAAGPTATGAAAGAAAAGAAAGASAAGAAAGASATGAASPGKSGAGASDTATSGTTTSGTAAAARDARETRTPEQRSADALIRMAADLAAADHTDSTGRASHPRRAAGDLPRVVVIMRETDLRERAEQAGILDNCQPIAPGDLRRLCCDADLTPVVLGTASEILDVGRSHRLVTPAIRRALTLRDGGCAFPRCSTDAIRCDAHHINPWWNGGETALNNLVLLCPHHHGIVEPARFWTDQPLDRWQVHIGTDGYPEFTPPARLDPARTLRKGERQPWAA